MTTEERIADALRVVAVKLETALDDGRPSRIDAHDLLETLLAVAEELDPPFDREATVLDDDDIRHAALDEET